MSIEIGTIVHASIVIVMLFWRPHPESPLVFFAIAGLWGVGDAVWQTQINGMFYLHILKRSWNQIEKKKIDKNPLSRSIWIIVQTKQGSCLLKLSIVGISWFCYCICLLDHIVCTHEAICIVWKLSPWCYWIHYC